MASLAWTMGAQRASQARSTGIARGHAQARTLTAVVACGSWLACCPADKRPADFRSDPLELVDLPSRVAVLYDSWVGPTM